MKQITTNWKTNLLAALFVIAAFWPLKLLVKTLTGGGDPFGLGIGGVFAMTALIAAWGIYKRMWWIYILVLLALVSDLVAGASGPFGVWGTWVVIGLLFWALLDSFLKKERGLV